MILHDLISFELLRVIWWALLQQRALLFGLRGDRGADGEAGAAEHTALNQQDAGAADESLLGSAAG